MTATTGCNWTATSSVPWIHVTSGSPASGSASFTFTIDANPGPARMGRAQPQGPLGSLRSHIDDVGLNVAHLAWGVLSDEDVLAQHLGREGLAGKEMPAGRGDTRLSSGTEKCTSLRRRKVHHGFVFEMVGRRSGGVA